MKDWKFCPRCGDRILLPRREHEPRKGSWDTVGGFLSGAETAEDNLVREELEEIGCELPPDVEIVLSEENSEYAWFPLDDRPPLAFADCEAAVAASAALTSRTGSA
ncbi:NUDIX domain-containing protein [Amycolatopsis sp. lyj-108]|uniref:NUDIX domain-containing protein n=1 Tax=Amycolatopsis sp. lyj-108 TaxID=2789286 RepID=UPI003978B337